MTANTISRTSKGAKYIFTPPLRPAKQTSNRFGTRCKLGYLQEVSTDHCPFNFKGQKEMGRDSFTKIPNGGPGVEDRLAMVYHGAMQRGFSLNKFVELTSRPPAQKCSACSRRRGPSRSVGCPTSSSSIPIVNRFDRQKTHAQNCDYNLFEGMKIKGVVETVLSRGKIIVENSKYVGHAGGRAGFSSAASCAT